MKQYQELLKDILDNGTKKVDRTGTGTISVFGRQFRHKMSDGFPLLTTKKMAWKQIVSELIWFLRGDTNIKYLLDNNNYIWVGDAHSYYLKHVQFSSNAYDRNVIASKPSDIEGFTEFKIGEPFTREEFIEQIKTNPIFCSKWGELGPIYGGQWRYIKKPRYDNGYVVSHERIDQIQQLISDLKNNPDSRRMLVSSWNVVDLDKMKLPPCHFSFQVYTRELTNEERAGVFESKYLGVGSRKSQKELDELNIPKRAISLMWNQRSCDTPLGIPFNIASYALLLEILAKEVNMVPDELIGNFGDCHIYLNQVDGVIEQINREPLKLCKLEIKDKEISDIADYEIEDFTLVDYQHLPAIKFPLSN